MDMKRRRESESNSSTNMAVCVQHFVTKKRSPVLLSSFPSIKRFVNYNTSNPQLGEYYSVRPMTSKERHLSRVWESEREHNMKVWQRCPEKLLKNLSINFSPSPQVLREPYFVMVKK